MPSLEDKEAALRREHEENARQKALLENQAHHLQEVSKHQTNKGADLDEGQAKLQQRLHDLEKKKQE